MKIMKKKKPAKKEFSIIEILSNSWKLFTENFKLILIITLIVYIPINIILSLVPVDTLVEQQGTLRGFGTYFRIIRILEGLVGIIATMAIAFAMKSKLDKKYIDFKIALKKSLSRWLPAIGTNILLGIFLLGLFLLLIIPGIVYSVYWAFTVYAVILYDKAGKKALDHSKSVVKGRWWKVFWYFLIFEVLAIIVAAIAAIPSWFLPENALFYIVSDTFIEDRKSVV